MEMTSEEINKISYEITQATVPVISSALDVAKNMGNRNNSRDYLVVHLDSQDYHVALDETQPIRVMKFSAPDNEESVYARVDAYRDNDGAFSFKLYKGNQEQVLKEGSAAHISEDLVRIVRERIQQSNIAKMGYRPAQNTDLGDVGYYIPEM